MNRVLGLSLGAILSVSVLAGCNSSSPTSDKGGPKCVPASKLDAAGIIGGLKVTSTNALSKKVVMLLADDGVICTGTPIAKDVILTAAHCVKGYKKVAAIFHTDITCESGFDLTKQSIEASDFIYHADFYEGSTNISNDVALVKLKSNIPNEYQVSKIYDGRTPLSSDRVTLLGYGKTDEVSGGSGYLRTTNKSFKGDIRLNDAKTAIEISQKWSGVCSGDSGGPVFYDVGGELQVAGVNSYVSGPKYAICHDKGVSTYTPSFVDWIDRQKLNLR